MNVERQLGKQVAWPSLLACVIVGSGVLTGCSKAEEKPVASQVVAKVNKQELTVHQVNFLLQQQNGLKPEQIDTARKQTLERLIDQELAIQKAAELKIDRNPRVVQQIEAARRDIIARAYFERLGDGASKPSGVQVSKYYAEHPALFAERRVYQLQEWFIEVSPAQVDEVRSKAKSSKSMAEFSDYLKSRNLKFEFNHAIRAAEQLPLSSLTTFGQMADGDTVINAKPNGLQVINLVASRRESVDLERVRPMIEKFLVNEQKGRIIADDLKALRMAAAIRYVGGLGDAASQPGGVQSPPSPPASSTVGGTLVGAADVQSGATLK